MFFGKYQHQIDEKSRIRIPSKLKDIVGDSPFIMRGPNNSLVVLKSEDAKKMLEEQFGNISIFDPSEKSRTLRMLTSTAIYAEEDKQGRMVLPASLLEHAKIKDKESGEINRNIVIVGVYNKIEIWSEPVWDKHTNAGEEDFDDNLFALVANKD
ncbi:MAG: hypothetical protein FWC11_06745 [Firmicutes bacterium]|nr:hypothetical protein [Bacillota bacterium]MCL2256523.1 hypothetical protein [Bacillota bacterium]